MMRSSTDAVLDTIRAIYASVGDRQKITETVCRVRELVNGSRAILITPDRDPTEGGFGLVDNFDANVFLQYRAENWNEAEPWLETAFRRNLVKTGAVLTDDMLLPRQELRKRAFFNEVLAPHDMERLCSITVNGDSNHLLPVTFLSVFRGVGAKAFTEEERRTLEVLAPHLLQALDLSYRIEVAEARARAAEAVWEELHHALILLDAVGRVLLMSREARAYCIDGAGLRAVSEPSGYCRLRARFRSEDTALQRMINCALTPRDTHNVVAMRSPLTLHGHSDELTLMVRISPLTHAERWFDTPAARACVTLERPFAAHVPSTEMLRAAFSLTPAECRTAQALASTLKPKAVANRFGLSESTVRTQIRALLRKTGAADLRELGARLSHIADERVPPF